MVSITIKKIKGKEYLYLVESLRREGKVIQKTVKYIGKKRPIHKEEFMCMQRSHKGEDWILSSFQDYLSYQDHQKMKKSSQQYYTHLKTLDSISKEKERENFLAVFISNSNTIEGSTLSQKETFDYLFNDITPKGHKKKELFMASNLLKAWQYLEEHYQNLPTEKDICMLHALVNRDIEDDKTLGKYKKVQNYVGDIHTTSYLFVKEKMEQLLLWISSAYQEIDDFEVAFQSHAQFELIHPFIDGNGRIGRLLMNWLLMYKGSAPLRVRSTRRAEYLSSLSNAQKGALEAICKFLLKEYLEQYDFM